MIKFTYQGRRKESKKELRNERTKGKKKGGKTESKKEESRNLKQIDANSHAVYPIQFQHRLSPSSGNY